VIKNFPEVETVVSQQGRPDDGTDATGFFNAEFFAPLKPAKEWRRGMTKDKLIEEGNEALEAKFPGVNFNFSQYIQDNVEEAVSGVKGENSVKLIGNDIVVLTETAEKIKDASISIERQPHVMGWRPVTSMRRFRPPSAGRPRAISMRREAIGTSPWSFGWRRNIGRTSRRSVV
jgi:Cu/Ag efflux pump CusA